MNPSVRVLVEDGSAAIRHLRTPAIRALALGSQAHLDRVDHGVDALRRLPQPRCDVMVTDINMPAIHGLPLILCIRQHAVQCSLPILVVTTQSPVRDRQEALNLGATACLAKPLNLDTQADACAPLWPVGGSL
jgi:CheY-like chemotaxis protein